MWKISSLTMENSLWHMNTRMLQHSMSSSWLLAVLTTPEGLGIIERQTQTIKKTLIKSEMEGTSLYLVMLELRATPLDDNTPSLAELLGNRKYKTTLPAVTKMPYNSEEVESFQEAGKCWPLESKTLSVSVWQPATVISTPGENTHRAYVVSTPDGAKQQKNRLM